MPFKYDYDKLVGRIKRVFKNRYTFAQQMGWCPQTCSWKLTNKATWTQTEISQACELLSIPTDEIAVYFFTLEVQ